jgi:hypothetical protein
MKLKRLSTVLLVTATIVPAIAGVAFAHHSFAATFDGSKPIRLVGSLTRIEWTNPHSYFYLDVKDEKTGKVTAWTLEAGSPGALSRRGFKRGDIKLGDTLIVDGYRAKDGSNLADARRVQLPDGRFVSGASAGDGGPEVNLPPASSPSSTPKGAK